MRPVSVFKNDNYEPGKGYTKCLDFKGTFHEWGLELFEQEQGSVSYSVAIIEKDDGTIVTVPPYMMRFENNEVENAPNSN